MAALRQGQHQLKLFMSNKYVYAQVVGDGKVKAAASTVEKALQEGLLSKSDAVACEKVGETVAQRAQAAGVPGVKWLRKRGQKYHGRTAALITAMQAAGLPLV